MVLSVLFGEQFDNFRHILEFYLPDKSKILDVTYGAGKLWQSVNQVSYPDWNVTKNDVDLEVKADYHYDFENLHKIGINDFDAVIYDPPYLYGRSSYIFYYQTDEDWTQNKTKWTVDAQVKCAQQLNNALPNLLRDDGFLIVKIMDSRENGKLVCNHDIIINEMTNLELKDIIIYVRLGVGVFKNNVSPQTAHGYYLIFQKPKYLQQIL
ncbi:MAG: hypothetical protein ACTSPB_14175 [Candidatus Thorarchaeota archaeon]